MTINVSGQKLNSVKMKDLHNNNFSCLYLVFFPSVQLLIIILLQDSYKDIWPGFMKHLVDLDAFFLAKMLIFMLLSDLDFCIFIEMNSANKP